VGQLVYNVDTSPNGLTVRRSIDGRSYAAPVVIDGVNRGGVIAVGDLTGDGRPDVARLSVIGESVVRLYAQTSTGRFVLRSTYQVLPQGWMRSQSSLAVGDLTGDGRRDFAVTIDANDPGSWIMVWPRTDVGTFGKPVIYPVYHNAESLALADMDRDGRLDAVPGLVTPTPTTPSQRPALALPATTQTSRVMLEY
jgi:hypothetical protein